MLVDLLRRETSPRVGSGLKLNFRQWRDVCEAPFFVLRRGKADLPELRHRRAAEGVKRGLRHAVEVFLERLELPLIVLCQHVIQTLTLASSLIQS
jgi:hypothetical protein